MNAQLDQYLERSQLVMTIYDPGGGGGGRSSSSRSLSPLSSVRGVLVNPQPGLGVHRAKVAKIPIALR